jgi:thiol:disulfide interchange protein DsbA
MRLFLFFFTLIFFTLNIQAKEASEDVPIKFKTLSTSNEFLFADPEKYDFEVLYFFSYACPYCYQFEPYLKLWKEKGLKDNTSFSKIPVQFNDNWIQSAIAFEIAKRLNISEEVNDKIYNYMHEENKDMFNKDDLLLFFVEEMNIKPEDFYKHYNSFSLNLKMKKYEKYTEQFEIMGTPTLILISKRGSTFLTSPSIAGHPVNILTTMDFIIEKLSEKY